ncbi:MAG: hypothetical protein LC775_00680, partial [Acidobacteria bacterium]|nr:hypothetical protein [Acidobacteriota bacterium]
VLYSTVLFTGLLIWAGNSGVLLGSGRSPWAFSLFFKAPSTSLNQVSLPLLFDPVGVVVLLTALATPLFCAPQVAAISVFNQMIEANIGYRISSLKVANINALVKKVNRAFSILGTRSVSLAIMLLSIFSSCEFYKFIQKDGLLQSWNPSSLADSQWRTLVYGGWWANADTHTAFAALLVLAGAYTLYHVTKQLTMGMIFSVYGRRALTKGFGVAPNLKLNTDGYHGLRKLRYFMQWTYAATLLYFLMAIGILVVWLPFGQLTVFLVSLIMATNVLTVFYPTWLAANGSLLEKKSYIKHLSERADLSDKELDELVDRVWTTPHLPFRLRGTLSAVTLYLLIPILLAVVSALLN